MRRFLFLLVPMILLSSMQAWAQFTVEDETKVKQEDVKFEDKMKNISVKADYYSAAKARLERQQIRKQRNTLTMTWYVQGVMNSYNEAWGGDNAIAVSGQFDFNHTYAKDKFNVNTVAQFRYGYNRVKVDREDGSRKGVWFKNVDNFFVQVRPGRSINQKWSYTLTTRLSSQLTNSYQGRTKQEPEHLTSSFMAPGTLTISAGLTFNNKSKPKFPIEISMNPLSTDGTMVFNEKLRDLYKSRGATNLHGVDIDKHAYFSGGSNVIMSFNRAWGKTRWFSYNTNLNSYCGWITNVMNHSKIKAYKRYEGELEAWKAAGSVEADKPQAVPRFVNLHPTVDWRNTFSMRIAKYFTTTFYCQMIYNKAQNTSVRIQSELKIGFSYTFKNK